VRQAYIYYRIDTRLAGHAAERIDALLRGMAPHCSLPPRRLTRCDDSAMWLEIYEEILDFETFAAALDSAVDSLDCAGFTLGQRHLECFLPPGQVPGQI
jgi:hypothetical protein